VDRNVAVPAEFVVVFLSPSRTSDNVEAHLKPNHEQLPLYFTERDIPLLLLDTAADIGSFDNLGTKSGPEKQKGESPVLSYLK
jgi:hypothetical protein